MTAPPRSFAFSEEPFTWRSESDAPPPERLCAVDEGWTADAALGRIGRGESLLYEGDFHNGRQLLQAMARRIPKESTRGLSAGEAFFAERRQRQREQETLSQLLVALSPSYALALP